MGLDISIELLTLIMFGSLLVLLMAGLPLAFVTGGLACVFLFILGDARALNIPQTSIVTNDKVQRRAYRTALCITMREESRFEKTAVQYGMYISYYIICIYFIHFCTRGISYYIRIF